MGCGSSKQAHNNGGGYPGAQRQANDPYVPEQSEFVPVDKTTAKVTKHFIAVGGGNALKLVDGPPPAPTDDKKFVQVTIPEGVGPGQELHVNSPDGQVISVIVPDGMVPGTIITVEFAADPQSK